MNYYMIITNKWDYVIDLENKFNIAGFPDRQKRQVEQMKPGDKIVYYVTKESKFCAISEVTGKYFYSTDQVWDDFYNLYPCRINTKPLYYSEAKVSSTGLTCKVKGVFIKDIWDNLSFITNKNKWGSQVMGSFRKLSKEDYEVIEKSLKELE